MVKVSVIIPTYNRAEYLRNCVDSVLAQTYTDYEIIVIDDGSTDNTEEVVESYGKRIVYLNPGKNGLSQARNLGVSQAKGEYLAFLDDDDLWLPEKLATQIPVLKSNKKLAFVCSAAFVINENDKTIDHYKQGEHNRETFDCLFEESFVMMLTVVLRKKCFDEVGGFDNKLYSSQDYDLWLRLAKRFPFRYLNIPLAKYRLHSGNMSKNYDRKVKDYNIIFKKEEIVGDYEFLKRKIRVAKYFFRYGEWYRKAHSYLKASYAYLRSVLHYPLIGKYYWPKETRNKRFSLPYRLLRPYLLTFGCFTKSLHNHERT